MLACALVVGCQTPGPQFGGFEPAPPGQTRLYVYRPPLAIATTPSVVFQIDGRELARVRNGGYSTVALPPGEYTLVAGPDGLAASPTLERQLSLVAGESLVCGYASSGSVDAPTWQLSCTSEAEAPRDLFTCDREPLSKSWSPPR